jgi:hypothetical protein
MSHEDPVILETLRATITENGSARVHLVDGSICILFPRSMTTQEVLPHGPVTVVSGLLADPESGAETVCALPVLAIEKILDKVE